MKANACRVVTLTRKVSINSIPTKDVVLRLLCSYFNSQKEGYICQYIV